MATINQLKDNLKTKESQDYLSRLYGRQRDVRSITCRLEKLADKFAAAFPDEEQASLFSTPGRTEVGGNHTDHNHGRVLAAAVDLDVIAAASPRADGQIIIHSEGYPVLRIDTRQLEKDPEERYTSTALVRGTCARFAQMGLEIGGFSAVILSDVPRGSGLSSSAAYEVMIGTILNHFYNRGSVDPVRIAQIAQFAENNYFGKPCGLMDQTTCSVGGFVTIDFGDPASPLVAKVQTEFEHSGLSLVIVETGGDHADLNEEYASVAGEMRAVARVLGGEVLADVREDELFKKLPEVRARTNDRAILRALHFFNDNRRVTAQVEALQHEDYRRFLSLVIESGRSSWMLNQNCFSTRKPTDQGIPLALALSEKLLAGGAGGAWRVHGGGFAGTIQAFVPREELAGYLSEMRRVFGEQACYPVSIRSQGSVRLPIRA